MSVFHTTDDLAVLQSMLANGVDVRLDGEHERITGLFWTGDLSVHVDLADGTGRWFGPGESIVTVP